jgi:hypothetical protein
MRQSCLTTIAWNISPIFHLLKFRSLVLPSLYGQYWTILILLGYTTPDNTLCQKTGGQRWSLTSNISDFEENFLCQKNVTF